MGPGERGQRGLHNPPQRGLGFCAVRRGTHASTGVRAGLCGTNAGAGACADGGGTGGTATGAAAAGDAGAGGAGEVKKWFLDPPGEHGQKMVF